MACGPPATPTAIIRDNSLLTKQPCSPPCWQRLTPGQTGLAAVESFLANDPVVNAGTVLSDTTADRKYFNFSWWWAGERQDPQRINRFSVSQAKGLEQITIIPNIDITPTQVIGVYGLPTLISVAVAGPHADKVHFSALYEDLQIEVQWLEDRDPAKSNYFCPTLNSPLIQIDYYSREYSDNRMQRLRDLMSSNPVGGGAGGAIVEGSSVIHTADGKIQIDCIKIR